MTKNELIQDITNSYNDWARSDLQAYCITTEENTEEILEEIDRELKAKGAGITTTPILKRRNLK